MAKRISYLKRDGDLNMELSRLLNEQMDLNDVTIFDLRDALGITYETARRLVRGTSTPPLPRLKLLCQYFGWKEVDVVKMAERDRAKRVEQKKRQPTKKKLI